ncbi:BSD domain-containing protein 1-like [Senna tora]|uniref:BSD domain-containing protein 1-like n=1 Tax=Senna tora TaxID=362788 RepID=A0A834W0V9_9FABA|nr:BSD domain-containing protein 1-like [Senna tora]
MVGETTPAVKPGWSLDDPNLPESEIPSNAPQNEVQGSPNTQSLPTEDPSDLSPSPNDDTSAAGGWNLGGFMRTLSTKSESILETYRRDLKEFGSGLKKEIEVAHGSLGTVGQTLDEFGNSVVKGTAQIISQGKDAILTANLGLNSDNNNQKYSSEKSLNSKLYSRFDAQVHAIQVDASTYCEESEDLDDYNKWKLDFSLEEKYEKTESLLKGNDAVYSMYKRVVPNSVDHETFWYRYYYKIDKFKKAEDVRARLVKRMSKQEEELSWDVEDDDDDGEYENKGKPNLLTNNEVGAEDYLGKKVETESQIGSSATATGNKVGTKGLNVEDVHNSSEEESEVKKRDQVLLSKELGHDTKSIDESRVENSAVVFGGVEASNLGGDSSVNKSAPDEKVMTEREGVDGKSSNNHSSLVASQQSATKSDEKVVTERKDDDGKSTNKDNDSSLVARQQHSALEEEEDLGLGWDEIEDLSSINEMKSTPSESQNKVQLHKRQTATEEDLSWDIEEDDDDRPSNPKA